MDYIDRVVSRHFQLLYMPVVDEILLFGAWICNRSKIALQVPLLIVWTYNFTEMVAIHYEKSSHTKVSKKLD